MSPDQDTIKFWTAEKAEWLETTIAENTPKWWQLAASIPLIKLIAAKIIKVNIIADRQEIFVFVNGKLVGEYTWPWPPKFIN